MRNSESKCSAEFFLFATSYEFEQNARALYQAQILLYSYLDQFGPQRKVEQVKNLLETYLRFSFWTVPVIERRIIDAIWHIGEGPLRTTPEITTPTNISKFLGEKPNLITAAISRMRRKQGNFFLVSQDCTDRRLYDYQLADRFIASALLLNHNSAEWSRRFKYGSVHEELERCQRIRPATEDPSYNYINERLNNLLWDVASGSSIYLPRSSTPPIM